MLFACLFTLLVYLIHESDPVPFVTRIVASLRSEMRVLKEAIATFKRR